MTITLTQQLKLQWRCNLKVILIAAIGRNGELGLDNKLLWKSPSDLAQFKAITEGYPIIMGRKTFDSLPGILPRRKHIVISESEVGHTSSVSYYGSLERALNQCKSNVGIIKVFIIGGASIYKQALELDLVDELFITHMNWEGNADTFLRIDFSKWKFVDTLATYSEEVGPSWSQKHYIKGNL